MRSYITPYEQFLTIEFAPELEKEITEMPNIEEYVSTELEEEFVGAVRFDYYLGLMAEDEKQLLELAIDYIRKYETVYPLSRHHYNFKCNAPNVDLRNTWLKAMFMRPGMYGIENLACLRAFLDGYFRMKAEYQLPVSEYEEKLLEFIGYWKARTNPQLPFDTWERAFAYEKVGTTAFSGAFSYELKRLEEMLFEETGMELIPPEIIGKTE